MLLYTSLLLSFFVYYTFNYCGPSNSNTYIDYPKYQVFEESIFPIWSIGGQKSKVNYQVTKFDPCTIILLFGCSCGKEKVKIIAYKCTVPLIHPT